MPHTHVHSHTILLTCKYKLLGKKLFLNLCLPRPGLDDILINTTYIFVQLQFFHSVYLPVCIM